MSLTREAFERIREAIVSGALEFGEPLSETQIAKALGMSKAPVRAAFMELRDKGMVNIVPQSGTYVFSPSEEDVRMLSSFRALLEDEAVRVANDAMGRVYGSGSMKRSYGCGAPWRSRIGTRTAKRTARFITRSLRNPKIAISSAPTTLARLR